MFFIRIDGMACYFIFFVINFRFLVSEASFPTSGRLHVAFPIVAERSLTFTLNRIHKWALDFVEDDDAEEEEDAHEGEGVGEGGPGEVALAEGGKLEGLDDGGHGVGKDEGAEAAFGNHAEGIDDGGAVHPELDDEGEEDAEVTVLGGHGGYQDAKAQAKSGKHNNHKDEKDNENENVDDSGGWREYHSEMDVGSAKEEIEVDSYEQADLYGETQQITEYGGDGDDQAGEVDLTEHAGIGNEGGGGLVETVGEVEPADVAGHVENGLGNAVGAHLGYAAKDHHVHDDSDDGLDDVPKRTEDGLLVLYDDVALDKQFDEVAVAPDFTEVNAPELVVRGDDCSIIFHIYNENEILNVNENEN